MHMIFKAQLWSRVQCHSPGVFASLRKENRCILCMMSEWFLAFSADKGCHFLERGYALTNIPGWLIDQDEVYPMFGANPWETQNIWLFTVETWQFGANKETQSWQNIWLIPWNLGNLVQIRRRRKKKEEIIDTVESWQLGANKKKKKKERQNNWYRGILATWCK